MKNKNDKKNIPLKDYERYDIGPFTFERYGRYMYAKSNWTEDGRAKFIQNIRKNRHKLKDEVNQKISRLIELSDEYDPLEFLSSISVKNTLVNPETYTEITFQGKECYLEYTLSLLLSKPRKDNVKKITDESVNEFVKLIEEIFNNILWYFGTEDKSNILEDELRFLSMMNFLYVRGDSYPEHYIEMIRDVFTKHDNFLTSNYSFTTAEIITCINDIEKQILANIRKIKILLQKGKELYEIYKKFSDSENLSNYNSFEEFRDKYLSLPNVQKKKKDFDEIADNTSFDIFEIKPTPASPMRLLDLLSVKFGDNTTFLSFIKTPGWPTNDSMIYNKPLIKENECYYCFGPQIMLKNLENIIEHLIQIKNQNYYNNIYLKSRADYLENRSLKYLCSIIPTAKVYGKLYYYINNNGEKERVETDGILLYDENIFIIEAKAGGYSISARRGGIERMKKNIGDLISDAYNQALRVKNYIELENKPRFEYENGNTALIIENKEQYKNIFLINVTLEKLGPLSTHLSHLRKLDLISGKEWPWSVHINDLRIISEINEFPSEFIHFLQRRIILNKFPQISSIDEIDFYMYYLSEGLYFKEEDFNKIARFTMVGYTEKLDRYYNFLAGRVSSGEKPKLNILEKYKKILLDIESTNKIRFTRITSVLLSLDGQGRDLIVKNIEKLIAQVHKDYREHDFTIIVKEASIGITFSIAINRDVNSWRKYDNYCEMKMYQTRLTEWILIMVDVDNIGNRVYDFKIFNKEWKYDHNMELQLHNFIKNKGLNFENKKISRNELCPCGSGLKYKKCCGKL